MRVLSNGAEIPDIMPDPLDTNSDNQVSLRFRAANRNKDNIKTTP